MEWVETTAKTVTEAREQALDRLGVGEDEAEFEIIDEPRPGLFGRVRGEARVRARIRPTAVRPKQDRRSRSRRARGTDDGEQPTTLRAVPADSVDSAATVRQPGSPTTMRQRRERGTVSSDVSNEGPTHDDGPSAAVDPEAVGAAAVEFMTGLAEAFGTPATATLTIDGSELDVHVDGAELGLLIGPGGRTLIAVQDLARVAAQRRLGDHETRLRIDVAGYRERRRAALEKFAVAVANEVRNSGRAKALEPMASADRKVVHDAIQGIAGVASHSDGEEPRRRVVIVPT